MNNQLPPRPHLDHLRRQAKALLEALAQGDPEAVATFQNFLPAAAKMKAKQVRQAGFRLADAQSAIARKTGFASWPQLARHVDQLRGLEGTWGFASLHVDGNAIPAGALKASRVLIDGDRFRTESPEATYEGVFNINVEADPHEIDIDFIAGPEAGNRNHGIFSLVGDQLQLCLDLNGKPRPRTFLAPPGSGHALETLRRTSAVRPQQVTGGTPAAQPATPPTLDPTGFQFVASPTLTRLQGEWEAVRVVRDGQEFPKMMLLTGRRSATQNEVKITFGGQLIIHALVRITEGDDPTPVDYCNIGGHAKGTVQLGIMKWIGNKACFCMAAPGQRRPTGFDSPPGSDQTLSEWQRKK